MLLDYLLNNWLEFIGVVSGLVCVWLLVKENILTFPVGLIYALITVVVVAAAWEVITERVNQYMGAFLILSGMSFQASLTFSSNSGGLSLSRVHQNRICPAGTKVVGSTWPPRNASAVVLHALGVMPRAAALLLLHA